MRKKWIALVAGFFVWSALTGCSGGRNEVYDLSADYADGNGYRGWSYYCGSVLDGTIEPMYFSEYRGYYRGGTDVDNDPVYIEKTLWKPSKKLVFGQPVVWEVMAGWRAPTKGRIHAKAELRLLRAQEPGNDGVTFYVVTDKSFENELDGISLRAENRDGTIEFDYEIAEGETVYFVLNPTDNGGNDETRVNITLQYR